MKGRIITILMLCIYTISNTQNTWSKEYDLGEGRKNFVRDIAVMDDQEFIYVSSWQFCPTEDPNLFLECCILSNYTKDGDFINEMIIDSTTGVENGNILMLNDTLLHITTLNYETKGRFFQLMKTDNILNKLSLNIIDSGAEIYTNVSGIKKILDDLYIFGTVFSFDFSEVTAFFAKLDDSLNVEIINKYPARQLNVFMNDLQPTPDGNLAFILKQKGPAGPTSNPGFEIYKVNYEGSVLDSFVFNEGFGLDWPFNLTIDEEGNYYFYSDYHPLESFPPSIGRMNKLNKDMKTLEWSVILPNSTYGRNYRIEESLLARNGDIIICGSMQDFLTFENSPDHVHTGFITRFDQDGNILWHHIYKVPNDEYLPQSEYGRYRFSRLTKIVEMEDGSLLAGGNHTYHWTVYDHPAFDDTKETNLLWLLKVDADGCLEGEECGEVIEIGRGILNKNISIGTKWTYEHKNYLTNTTSYIEYTVTDTLMWEGKSAFKIMSSDNVIYGYLHIEDDKYYFWNDGLNDYQLNYDFGEEDSYEIPFMKNGTVEFATIKIDSTGKELLDGKWLDVQYVSTNFGFENEQPRNLVFYSNIGYSRIGPKLDVGIIVDLITESIEDIRCYKDDSLDINFKNYPCDSVWQILNVQDWQNVIFKVFPNPTSTNFTIDFEEFNRNYTLKFIDLTGNVLWYGTPQKNIEFSVDKYESGLYLLKLENENGKTIQTEKLAIIK